MEKNLELHLTLKFIGEVKENRISDIRRALENVCPSLNPFEVTFKNLGVFPNMKMPRILWMGVESRELLSLQEAIETQLCAIEIPKEDRRYQPHITLASGRIEGMNNAVLWEGQSIDHKAKVMSFELMQSTVEQDGRKYRSIAEYIFTNRIGNDRV